MRMFTGCAFFRGVKDKDLPSHYLTREQLDPLVPTLVGKPICIRHIHQQQIGIITDAWLDTYGGVHIEFVVYNNKVYLELLNRRILMGLSLCHGFDVNGNLVLVEVSICHLGARYGTVINIARPNSRYKCYTQSAQYKPADSLLHPVNLYHIKMSALDAAASGVAQTIAGNPGVMGGGVM